MTNLNDALSSFLSPFLSFFAILLSPAEVQHDVLQGAGVAVGEHETVSAPPGRVRRREVHELRVKERNQGRIDHNETGRGGRSRARIDFDLELDRTTQKVDMT